jgi:hypothetical protein
MKGKKMIGVRPDHDLALYLFAPDLFAIFRIGQPWDAR